ncbi:SDR family NAD(P)-dependent oxidoreductase [Rhizobium mesoamericanum]|uniref:SDR family NAD(P)-dependent oxidoreductase n=1 Tax=Rhizobium mesoamericanum TaxID=1079800 RepID=UPI0027D79B36|nr:SDR family NAD(P)-dependent oxidoreductase [Rhizobium mesoamericanum]
MAIIITGAGSGIGKEIALRFAADGGVPVITNLNLDAANAPVAEIKELLCQCRKDAFSPIRMRLNDVSHKAKAHKSCQPGCRHVLAGSFPTASLRWFIPSYSFRWFCRSLHCDVSNPSATALECCTTHIGEFGRRQCQKKL